MLTPSLVEKRNALSPFARRAGWVGCTISLEGIPKAGRIFLIKERIPEPRDKVLAHWRQIAFIRGLGDAEAKGWLLSVMRCIDRIQKPIFNIEDLYKYEDDLKLSYPANRHIRAKIRQQLQVLRDKGYLEFAEKGVYRLCPPSVQS